MWWGERECSGGKGRRVPATRAPLAYATLLSSPPLGASMLLHAKCRKVRFPKVVLISHGARYRAIAQGMVQMEDDAASLEAEMACWYV